MTQITRTTTAGAVAVGLSVLAGCGSGTSAATTAPADSTTAPASSSSSGLHVGHTSLGDVLVDRQGHTVYLLTADRSGKSSCDATCAAVWPPVPPSTAAHGVTGQLARTTTPSGTAVATLGGVPLYTFSGDNAAGEVKGEGIHSFGGEWYAVSPSGTKVEAGDGNGTDAGGGYAY